MRYRLIFCFFFFFKQKTAYEMRISDWSSDVCSSDLGQCKRRAEIGHGKNIGPQSRNADQQAGRTAGVRTQRRETLPEPDYKVREREIRPARSEERRVGKEGVRTCRSRLSPYH